MHTGEVAAYRAGAGAEGPGRLDPDLRAVIKRHVVQVDAHNRYLEKRQMWRQHEKEEKERLGKRHLGSRQSEPSAS